MALNQSIQAELTNSLNFNNLSQVNNFGQEENNPQFLSSTSHHRDIEEASRQIAFNIFKPSDEHLFNNISNIADIQRYYKDLIVANYPNFSNYDFTIVFNIIKTYLNIYNIFPYSPPDFITRVTSNEYLIFKTPPEGSKICSLTQKDRFFVAKAVKNYKKELSRQKQRHTKNRKAEIPNYIMENISVKDKQGRYSTKTEIIFNEPETVDINLSHSSGSLPHGSHLDNQEQDHTQEEVVIRDHGSISMDVSEMIESSEYIHYDMLYYTTNHPVKKLDWDGTHIGKFNKSEFEIVKTQTTLGNKFMLLYINGQQFWSEYIKLSDDDNFSLLCAIDEWKPLFGLEKLGSHSIILDNKKYILFKTPDPLTIFSISKKLSSINPKMVKGEHLDQIRAIILFKYIIGSPFKLRHSGNFIKYNIATSKFFSHNDLSVRSCHDSLDLPNSIINRWLTDMVENERTDKEQYLIILSKILHNILDINNDYDKEINPSLLRSDMENIGRRINSQGESNFCIAFIISRVRHLLDSN